MTRADTSRILREHTRAWWRFWRRPTECRKCGHVWKCPARIEAERSRHYWSASPLGDVS